MNPQPNLLRIDSVRRSEGWREYVKFLEEKFLQSTEKLISEGGEVNRGYTLALKEILAFAKKPPAPVPDPRFLSENEQVSPPLNRFRNEVV